MGKRMNQLAFACCAVWLSCSSFTTSVNGALDLKKGKEKNAAMFQPTEIDLENLINDERFEMESKDVLFSSLHETGIVTITGIPGFAELKEKVLLLAPQCAKVSKAAVSATLDDGTVRTTIAGVTSKSDQQNIQHEHDDCVEFDKLSTVFRGIINEVSAKLAHRISQSLDIESNQPLLHGANGLEYKTFFDLVQAGEHLEHFHSYHSKVDVEKKTVEMHTDQGLFIAFTPPVLLDEKNRKSNTKPGEFLVEMKDGSVKEMIVGNQNSLVFMLGDGVEQLVNEFLDIKLRSVPHAFEMPIGFNGQRSWYGRMFLPPQDAFLPGQSKVTFGELRHNTIEASLGEEDINVLSLGCSGDMVARELAAASCEAGSIFCWHRCMPYTDEASPDVCANQGLEFNCTSQFDQIWTPAAGHGDFNPACHEENATLVTPPPAMPSASETCDALRPSKDTWSGKRQFHEDLTFYWNITDNDEIKGRLIFEGLASWLSIGLRDPAGKKNGMHGSKILMGHYVFPGDSVLVDEYQIHPSATAFRLWETPLVNKSASELTLSTIGDCFTVLDFVASGVGLDKFDMNGPNDIIWGAATSHYLLQGRDGKVAAYHGAYRGYQNVDFNQFSVPVPSVSEPDSVVDETVIVGGVLGGVCAILLGALIFVTVRRKGDAKTRATSIGNGKV